MKLTTNQKIVLSQAWHNGDEPQDFVARWGVTDSGITRAVNALIAFGLLTQDKIITELGEEAFWEISRI
jgi:hypothetical protein